MTHPTCHDACWDLDCQRLASRASLGVSPLTYPRTRPGVLVHNMGKRQALGLDQGLMDKLNGHRGYSKQLE